VGVLANCLSGVFYHEPCWRCLKAGKLAVVSAATLIPTGGMHAKMIVLLLINMAVDASLQHLQVRNSSTWVVDDHINSLYVNCTCAVAPCSSYAK
jgi:hypothetical protein